MLKDNDPKAATTKRFATAVEDFWVRCVARSVPTDRVHVVVDATLADSRAVSLVTVTHGPRVLAVTPAHAAAVGFANGDLIAPELMTSAFEIANISLNDPDDVFHFTIEEGQALVEEPTRPGVRRLSLDDRAAFERFIDDAPDQDVDEAFVELDHWLVFGCFVDERLVSAASMYPWDASTLADTGVLTLPEFRGRGYGAATVRGLSARALQLGYEPQYRCQVDNVGSVSLARSAGLTHFGTWEVILPTD